MMRINIFDSGFFIYHRSLIFTLILITSAFFKNVAANLMYDQPETNFTFFQDDSLLKDSLNVIVISGIINNNFYESIDTVNVLATAEEFNTTACSNDSGLFNIKIPFVPGNPVKTVHLSFYRYDYFPLDTDLVITNQASVERLNIVLIPKYKILLKGRLYAGNDLLEDVEVNIRYDNQIRQLKTKRCYYDAENYWNCLYLGMFKAEMVTDNPEDSIYLSFSKSGFKSKSYTMRFADYSGDILKFRMKYADTIPDLPNNNLNLKLTYPFGKNSGWFLGFSFYRKLNNKILDRFRPGIEISLSSHKRSVSLNTLPGVSESNFDTIYTNFFIGPSLMFFITKPYIRRFSTYIGSTFSLAFDGGAFVLQPFFGTRYFIDMRKSISMDLRYISYDLNARNYSFSYTGNATGSNENISVERILINVGLQIYF